MLGGDVADQLGDDHRLAHAGATEDAGLAALGERGDQVDDLDARLEHFDLGRLLLEGRRRPVDRVFDLRLHRSSLIDRLTDDIQDAAKRFGTDRDGIGAPMFLTSMPRRSPSVELIATVRTQSLPRCCWTSRVNGSPPSGTTSSA